MISEKQSEREIYIVIDPQRIRYNSLDIAILLAERLKTGISAGLVSNQILRQVASLPFTTEILLSSGEERDFATESIEYSETKNTVLVKQLLEQRALTRKIALKIEKAEETLSLSMALEKQKDVFLPALRRSFRLEGKGRRVSTVQTVKWVYDNCAASERCFLLLKELVDVGITKRIYVYGSRAVPSNILSNLADSGARVYWINGTSEIEMLQKLQSGLDVDLILLPASFSTRVGDAKLQDLNRHCVAPILVVC